MAAVATENIKIRDYNVDDALQIVRLFYDTVCSVNRADYSEEQVRAWAPGVPDPEEWHARMADRRTLVAEDGGAVVGFAELDGDGGRGVLLVRGGCAGGGGAALGDGVPRAGGGWAPRRALRARGLRGPRRRPAALPGGREGGPKS